MARMTKAELKKKESLQYVVSDSTITMSNALTRAGHRLTLAEKRIVMLAVSKLNPLKPVRPTEVPCTRIDASEYADTFGVDMDTAYDQLQSAAKHLYERSIMFFEPAHKRNGKPIKPAKSIMRWVGRATYNEGEAWVELAWWPEILPHLMGIKKQFTEYQLKQVNALRSIHSWRLLELLMRFRSTGWAEYTIEDFCVSMDATEKQRLNFGKVRTQIIEPAIKELTEKDGWQIEWKPIKAGRKVKALRFDFSRSSKGVLPKPGMSAPKFESEKRRNQQDRDPDTVDWVEEF